MTPQRCSEIVEHDLIEIKSGVVEMEKTLASALAALNDSVVSAGKQVELMVRFYNKIFYFFCALTLGLIFGTEVLHKFLGFIGPAFAH